MTPEQALQYLAQALVLKAGLSIQEAATAVAAYNIVAEALRPKPVKKEE